MTNFRTSQRHIREAFAPPTASLVPPMHPFAPPSLYASLPPSGDLQANLEQARPSGWSFEHISVHRPDLDTVERNETEQTTPPLSTAAIQRTSEHLDAPQHREPIGWSFARIAVTREDLKSTYQYATDTSMLQMKSSPQEAVLQQKPAEPTLRQENTTGLPADLKEQIETLSDLSLDDVHVHYNSSKPAEVHALAYTQGTEIHLGPGQEQHLAHEAWHVVQQKQGRVQPTTQMKGIALNDNQELEREADAMGSKASNNGNLSGKVTRAEVHLIQEQPLQRKLIYSKEAADDDQKALTPEKVGKEGTLSAPLINSAEPLQIPELARALGQDPIAYEEGKNTPLKGEILHYLVGHVVNMEADNTAYWGTHEPEQVAKDFVNGGIEAPSTLKLIACKAGQLFGPQLAAELEQRGKKVTVIASTGVVHATAEGIASYAPEKDYKKRTAQEQGFTGKITGETTQVIDDVTGMRKSLSRSIDKYRTNVRALLAKGSDDEAFQLVKQMKAEIADFFTNAVKTLNQVQTKSGPFATTAEEGWVASLGKGTQPVTAEQAIIGVPTPSNLPKVYQEIEVPVLTALYFPSDILGPIAVPLPMALFSQQGGNGTPPPFLVELANAQQDEVLCIFDINRSH